MPQLAILGGNPLREKPFHGWPLYGKTEEKYLLNTLRKNKWGIGKRVGVIQEFEEKFVKYHEAAGGVACTNCSQALEIMLSVSGIQAGDQVIVPAYSFIATASSVARIGAIPVFADIDQDTYVMDPESVRSVITKNTKAIIPVHFAGHFADMEKLNEIAQKSNLVIIEDAAQAHGAKWNGVFSGKYGIAAGFSFQYSKNMTAGEGGIIISKDSDFIRRCWEFIWHGRKQGGLWYEHFKATSNFRITEWSAAILLAQLQKLRKQNTLRMENATYLSELLKKDKFVIPAKVDMRTEIHPYHLFIMRLNRDVFKDLKKDIIVEALNAEGIPAFSGYGFPLYKNPAFQHGEFGIKGIEINYNYKDVYLPVSEQACSDTIWFLHYILLGSKKDMKDLAEGIKKVAQNVTALKEFQRYKIAHCES